MLLVKPSITKVTSITYLLAPDCFLLYAVLELLVRNGAVYLLSRLLEFQGHHPLLLVAFDIANKEFLGERALPYGPTAAIVCRLRENAAVMNQCSLVESSATGLCLQIISQ